MNSRGMALVVDDDEAIREAAREILEVEGYAVREAANGREALAALEDGIQPPCVMLLDMMMPVMDGHAVLAALDARPQLLQGVRVVVWTASRDKHFGPPEPLRVLRKPFDVDALLDAVGAACSASPA
jgi:CheY-like chemotaxis protein